MNNPRKRQRRQAAALVVQSFFDMGKKSTAQPRPTLDVPPRGIGPIRIEDFNENDVLSGRGGRINAHEGNIRYRDIINSNKKIYLAKTTKKLEKAHIAKRIVDDIRISNPSGRFLKEDATDGLWYDIGDAKAIKKTGQALREDAPGVRKELDDDSSGDEAAQTPPAPVTSAGNAVKTGPGRGAAPTGYVSGHGYANTSQPQQNGQWSNVNAPQGYMASVGETAPAYHPYQVSLPNGSSQTQYHRAHSQPNIGFYDVPAQSNSRARTGANEAAHISQLAAEAMLLASTTSNGDIPLHQRAFGRVFNPTVLSSGSTMSSISGLSGADLAHSGTSGAPMQRQINARRSQGSLRVSQLSEMTNSFMSLGSSFGLTRSSSFPELSMSIRVGTSLSEASFAALMEEDRVEQGYAAMGSELRNSSSSSSNRPPVPQGQPRTRTTSHTSAVSAMSWASAGSQRSTVSPSVRSSGSDTSWLQPYKSQMGEWNDSPSSRYEHSCCLMLMYESLMLFTDSIVSFFFSFYSSIMSDVSADVLALDLAGIY
jgi:hypothetical protein